MQEYLVDLNATRAAVAAGYSEKTADVIGYENLKKPQIAAAIQEEMDTRSRRTEIDQDFVLGELREIAGAEASDETGSALKYAAKLKALELLGKHLGMFTDRVEHAGETTVQVVLGKELEEMAE